MLHATTCPGSPVRRATTSRATSPAMLRRIPTPWIALCTISSLSEYDPASSLAVIAASRRDSKRKDRAFRVPCGKKRLHSSGGRDHEADDLLAGGRQARSGRQDRR